MLLLLLLLPLLLLPLPLLQPLLLTLHDRRPDLPQLRHNRRH